METKKLFVKYRRRMILIGLLKAIICGLIVGFAVNFVVAFVTWFTVKPAAEAVDHSALILVLSLSIGIGLFTALVCTVAFYFRFFRPTTKNIARAVDRLGLEERLITMQELENDESYIAMRQREDAKQHLSGVSAKSLKFAIPKLAIILLCVLGVFGVGMTTVTALSAEAIIKNPDDIWEALQPEEFVAINYMVWTGGYIEGEPMQIIKRGANTEPVVAIADDGWVFMMWAEDGYDSAERMDYKVMGEENPDGSYSFTRTAYFVPIQENDSEEENNNNNQEQDQPDDQPKDGKDDQWMSDPLEGEGDGNDEDPPDTDQPPIGPPPSTDNNSVIDGETDYHSEFHQQDVMDQLQSNNEIPDWLKDIIGGYFGTLG